MGSRYNGRKSKQGSRMTKRFLSGVKPTGTPHLGNYFGMIEPALSMVGDYDESFLFIANVHALNQVQDATRLEDFTLSITATYLACGLDPNKTHIYLQSDIPEDQVLATILQSFTPKGWMNKAHAYKAATDKNSADNKPVDDGVSMGLYTYPILMAADILLFDANVVPVGKDQIQHVEIARDIANRVNSQYGTNVLTPPEVLVKEDVQTITGLDGRKMSKSYDNIIPLFATPSERREAVNKIVTDSSPPDAKKRVEGTPLFELYSLVADQPATTTFKSELETGNMGWGDAKAQLAEQLDERFGTMTEAYNKLMANPNEVKAILANGAKQARPIAESVLARVKHAIGFEL